MDGQVLPDTQVPEPFYEIKRAHTAFEIFELDSARIGSGRPEGPRSQLWGSVVVLARAALEQALRRIHRHLCADTQCEDPQLDPHKFERFLQDHDIEAMDTVPLGLHVSLRRKDVAKAGHGSGIPVNGPMSRQDLLGLLGVLNHTRNGFVHQERKKTEKLHEYGAGLLWVPPEQGTVWTVQKPHAFSTIRFCHAVFRFVILCAWGEVAAMSARTELPLTLEDRLERMQIDDVNQILRELSSFVSESYTGSALDAAKEIQLSLLRLNLVGEDSQPTLDDSMDWAPVPLSDPLV